METNIIEFSYAESQEWLILSAVINGADSELENRKIVFINQICLCFLGVKLFLFEGRKKITSDLKKRANLQDQFR